MSLSPASLFRIVEPLAPTHEHSPERLAPVYRVSQDLPLPETEHLN
ncbi:MAG: hypothetical protein H0V35_00620 [Nitrospira sp.]|nr:hypothetical protein [Nitrospira sp.]